MKALIAVIFLFSYESFGQTLTGGQRVSNSNTNSVTNSTQTQLTNGTQGGTGSQGTSSTGPQGSDPNATGGFAATPVGGLTHANQAASSGNSTQIIGLAMGAAFAAVCAQPFQQWACPIAAQSFMDALSAGRARDNAINTANYIDPNYDPNTNPIADYETQNQEAIDGINQMSGMGYTVNPDGSVTSPDGVSVAAGEMMTPSGLAAKGFNPQQIEAIMNKIKDVQTAALEKAGVDPNSVSGQAVAGSGGGLGSGAGADGYGSGMASQGSEWVEIEEIRGGRKLAKDNRMPASQAAKLSKNFNGSPIGIGMADIFLIVQQKYDEKKLKKTEFINREY